jgi:hypothetical protein
MSSFSKVCLVLVVATLGGLAAGCDFASSRDHQRFVPTPEKARATITTALEAWQRGDPVGELKGTQPLIFVTDAHRRDGQKLEQYEILGEVPGATQRTYLVKVRFANPPAEEKIRYAVLGIDPLWVYRHEDLELLAHWDHAMPPTKPAEAADKSEIRP